ncbi:Elongator subunit elp4 [Coemansia javaensis]|uniref:Elongator complex protein 4 n=1 Tax=Coemansia javaensis TaxID=2761396 RepID=A0A9W8HLN1_9FUNG|nr:Elongator subunit elp4 [Coemansia javaensis]
MSSFRRHAPAAQPKPPPATRINPHSAQLLVSTGVPALDDVLGGGLPVGGILLVEEDRQTGYSAVLMSCFASQAVAAGHRLCVVDADRDVDPKTQFPGWSGSASSVGAAEAPPPPPPPAAKGGDEDPMKIAWRYQSLPRVDEADGSGDAQRGAAAPGVPFCERFDLSLRISAAAVEAAQIDVLDADCIRRMAGGEQYGGDMYQCVLDRVSGLIDGGFSSLQAAPPGADRNVLRISIQSLGSGFWRGSDSLSILRFLHRLRGILRYSYAVCMVSFPAHLYEDAGARLPIVRRVEHLCDAVIELESFEGARTTPSAIVARQARNAAAAAAAAVQDYHGFVHIHKLPRLNSLTPSTGRLSLLHTGGGSANNLAFRLRRKRFSIETYHLPIEGGVGERRTPADPASSGGGCGSLSARADPLAF